MHSLSFSFRISASWISKILRDVFDAIAKNMLFLMPKPNEAAFKSTEREFRERWNFPNVVGCLDGKHIRIRCPPKSGSLYYNYKNYFSIILFALSDANCKFMAIDVGSFGREGDAGNSFSNTFVFDSSIEMNYHLNRYLPKIANRPMYSKQTLRLARPKAIAKY